MLTQLLKLVIVATLLPSFDYYIFEVFQKIVHLLLGAGDVAAVYLLLNYVKISSDVKTLAVGLGWGAAQSLLTKFAPLWIGARGTEFDWKYIQDSIDANISLLLALSFVRLVWQFSRRRRATQQNPKAPSQSEVYENILLVAHLLLPTILEFLRTVAGLNPWIVLGVHGVAGGTLVSLSWKE